MSQEYGLFDPKGEGRDLAIFDVKYGSRQTISKNDLFGGFKTLYGMTFSCDLAFLASILPYFEKAEIVLGSEHVLGNEIISIFAVEKFTIEMLRPYLTKNEDVVYQMYYDKRLKLYVSQKLSHGKLFICEGDGKSRIICGSSNMTVKGFSGQQNEINFKIDDDATAFADFKKMFSGVCQNVNEARPILEESVRYDTENTELSNLPFSKYVNANKVFVLDVTNIVEDKTSVDMMLDINRNKIEVERFITPEDAVSQNGKTLVTADAIMRIHNRQVITEENEVKENRKLNNLEINFDQNEVFFNGKPSIKTFDEDKVREDIKILKDYFDGFEKYEFLGDFKQIWRNCYKLLNYMFVSPFMCYFRNSYLRRGDTNKAEDLYQLFAILYGESGTGKSSIVRFIMKMMYRRNNEVPKEYFTETNIRDLRISYKGLPLYIDDLDKGRYDSHSDKIIKDATFGRINTVENYPACVISLNKVGSVSDYIRRRAVMIKIEGKHNTKYRPDGVADKLIKKMSNNLYLKYLSFMLPRAKELLAVCVADIEGEHKIDLYYESSKILHSLLENENFEYSSVLNYEDYFGDRELGRDALKAFIEIYRIDRKNRFGKRKIAVYKDLNKVEYRNETSNEWGNRPLAEELPAYLKTKFNKYGITINDYQLLKRDFWDLARIRI